MSLNWNECEKFNLSQARLEGQHKARVDQFYRHYSRIYEANPEMLGDDFLKIYDTSIALMDQEDPPLGWGITINPGNEQILEESDEVLNDFKFKFCTPFELNISRKYSIRDYSFTVEAAPQTGRLHVHGKVRRAPAKTKIYPSEVKQQIWQCIPDYYRKKMNLKHVEVNPIYNQKAWEGYCSKDALYSFSTFEDEIKKKKNKNKNPK